MQINTNRFGEITVDENAILSFPDGIPGFEHTRTFVLIPHKAANGQPSPFRWLQCIEEPNLALPVINPWAVNADYAPTIAASVLRQMGITDVRTQAQFLSVVTIPANNPTSITVNLLAPVLINRADRTGRQVIVQNERYSIRTPLLLAAEPAVEEHVAEVAPRRTHASRELVAAAA